MLVSSLLEGYHTDPYAQVSYITGLFVRGYLLERVYHISYRLCLFRSIKMSQQYISNLLFG